MNGPKDATCLTEKYPGQESELWTPCIYDFFCAYKPSLFVTACINDPLPTGPWFKPREQSDFLKIDGDVLKEASQDVFLPKIGEMFGIDMMNDPGRYVEGNDIAGIVPDITVILPDRQGVYIIENKPYFESTFDGNQGLGGAYIDFVKWLNKKTIHCQYLIVQPISWKAYSKVKQVQDEIPIYFGILLLEDIFLNMTKHGFSYDRINERWCDFSNKGSDYA